MKIKEAILDSIPSNEYSVKKMKNKTVYLENSRSSIRSKSIVEGLNYIEEHPLNLNLLYRALKCLEETGKETEFTDEVGINKEKLNKYYHQISQGKRVKDIINPETYTSLILYTRLKLLGGYNSSYDDDVFGVTKKDGREFNPITKVSSIFRSGIGLDMFEYDIKAAVPTFIDLELGTDARINIYDKISKSGLFSLLNDHAESETKKSYESIIDDLQPIYGKRSYDVLTKEIYSSKGAFYRKMANIENDVIQKFINNNHLERYIRCHDALFTLTKCKELSFGKIEFVEKCIVGKIEEPLKFYSISNDHKVFTSASQYKDLLLNKGFSRINREDDRINLIFNESKTARFYSHQTELVSYLQSLVLEPDGIANMIKDKIARDNNNVIKDALISMPSTKLNYYIDDAKSICIPFKNGVYKVTDTTSELLNYDDFNGYFAESKSVFHNFTYTETVGDFEKFVHRVSTGITEFNPASETFVCFQSMIGYLLSSYKNPSKNYCIILSDMDAVDNERNGRRGKSLIYQAIEKVRKTLYKGGKEFSPSYTHNYADLDESIGIYVIDDVAAGFNYHDLFTSITGDISCQLKGSKAITIPFEDAPKFIATTNFYFRVEENDHSIKGRFIEYKFTNYYNADKKPEDEFNKLFFIDWNEEEWNKFYSFFVRCSKQFIKNGVLRIAYDKSKDNANALLESRSTIEFLEDAISTAIKINPYNGFSVSNVLDQLRYNSYMKNVNKNNAEKYIEAFLKSEYNKLGSFNRNSDRKWVRIG